MNGTSRAWRDERLTAWLDDRLDDVERRRFEVELQRDPELRAELQELEGFVRALRTVPEVKAPSDFLSQVQGRIRRRTRGRFWIGWVSITQHRGLPRAMRPR